MLTRLEVDGFKNLLDVTVEFGPYTCVVGANGVGKSNLFDAIHFLSLLADRPIMQAAALVRGASGRRADPRGLFWSDGGTTGKLIRLAAEMIVPKEVRDDFGRRAAATTTFLRYELELAYVEPDESGGLGRIELRREQLVHIKEADAGKRLRFRHAAKRFRDHIVHNHRSGTAYISTERDEGSPTIRVHQDGGTRGLPNRAPARRAGSTVVGSTSDAGYPTILTVRREMQSWRTLALEPSRLRAPDEVDAIALDLRLSEDGAHLPHQLYSLAHPPRGDEGGPLDAYPPPAELETRVYGGVAARLSQLIGVHEVRVERDDQRGLLTLQVKESRDGGFRDARQVSDGTLRFLALAVIDQDPRVGGLVCTEEPENGIHPARMRAMHALIRGLAVDPYDYPGPDNALRQVIVNTHSVPYLRLDLAQNPDDVLFAETVMVRRDGRPTRTVAFRPVAGSWRARDGRSGVTPEYIQHYLEDALGGHLPLLAPGAA